MPEYLATTGYKNPSNPINGIFQYTKGSKGNLFDYYDTHPQESETFNHIMNGVMAHQAGWLDIYPHETLLALGSHGPLADDTAILVDVGGNTGGDLERFRLVHPEQAGRLVLQDRPEVVCRAICPPPVQKMAHDFFTPQPIQGKLPIMNLWA